MKKKYALTWGIPLAIVLLYFGHYEFSNLGGEPGDLFSNFLWWLMDLHWSMKTIGVAFFVWFPIHILFYGKVDGWLYRKLLQWRYNGKS